LALKLNQSIGSVNNASLSYKKVGDVVSPPH